MGPSLIDVTHLRELRALAKGNVTPLAYIFSKMGDKGEGGVKNIKKWVTSFMDGPRKRLGLITQPHLHKYLDTASYFFWWSTYRNIFMIGICMSQYVCLCNISLMLLLWIDLQNAYLEQKKVISVFSTIYYICMFVCCAMHVIPGSYIISLEKFVSDNASNSFCLPFAIEVWWHHHSSLFISH